ncbi:MAG: hypothetical protein QM723_12075 [Myxococcaceae bacterium]
MAVFSCNDRTRLVPAYSEVGLTCEAGTFTLARASPSAMLVLDRSGSMANAFGNGTRWSTLAQTLAATLPQVASDLELGAYLFPAGDGAAQCSVPGAAALLPATGQSAELIALLDQTAPGGATPTADAVNAAAIALDTYASQGKSLALVLATDGAPNCNPSLDLSSCTCPAQSCASALQCLDDARTESRVAAWAAQGIPTWVIGIATDDTSASVLDALAKAGGRPSGGAHDYYSASSTAELTEALSTIQSQLRSCAFTTPSVPSSSGSIVVTLDGAVVPFDASGADGWEWSALDRGELVLRGSWCARAEQSATATLIAAITCDADAGVDAGNAIAE